MEGQCTALLLGVGTTRAETALLWSVPADPAPAPPLIAGALATLLALPSIATLCLLAPRQHQKEALALAAGDARVLVVPTSPGQTPGERLYRGLVACPPTPLVVIHEGARPFITTELVQRVLAATEDACVCAAIPARETMKLVDDARRVIGSPERARLALLQTPLAGPLARLRQAATAAPLAPHCFALALATGLPLRTVPGSTLNARVTSPAEVAEWQARGQPGANDPAASAGL